VGAIVGVGEAARVGVAGGRGVTVGVPSNREIEMDSLHAVVSSDKTSTMGRTCPNVRRETRLTTHLLIPPCACEYCITTEAVLLLVEMAYHVSGGSRVRRDRLWLRLPTSRLGVPRKLGAEGWELVHMEPVGGVGKKGDVSFIRGYGSMTVWSNAYFCVFKRRKGA
jgi:hypothetical protein